MPIKQRRTEEEIAAIYKAKLDAARAKFEAAVAKAQTAKDVAHKRAQKAFSKERSSADSERVQGLVEIGALDPKNPAATGDPNAAVPNPPRQNKAPWATA